MSAIETSIGPPATVVTVSPQPSLVTDIITSNTPNAAPLSGASTPFVSRIQLWQSKVIHLLSAESKPPSEVQAVQFLPDSRL